jgi:tyrosyl-tRNA synthetase
MNDLFGGHHTTGSPLLIGVSETRVYKSRGSSIMPAMANVSIDSKNRVGGGREASPPWYCRLVKTTMAQQSIQELVSEDLDTKTSLRAALELAAQAVEKQFGNAMYTAAFKKSAALIRSLKPD